MNDPIYYTVQGLVCRQYSSFAIACLALERNYTAFGVHRSVWPPDDPHTNYVGYVVIEQNGAEVGRIDHRTACRIVREYQLWETLQKNDGIIPAEVEKALLLHFWDSCAPAYVSAPYMGQVFSTIQQ